MSNVNQVLTGLTLGSGSNWYYWFYPHGGSFIDFPGIEQNKTVMTFAVRPNSSGHWFLKADHTIVVTELGPGAGRRHSYRLNVQNNDKEFSRSFSIAAAEIRG